MVRLELRIFFVPVTMKYSPKQPKSAALKSYYQTLKKETKECQTETENQEADINTLKLENDALKLENEALKLEKEASRLENEAFRTKSKKLLFIMIFITFGILVISMSVGLGLKRNGSADDGIPITDECGTILEFPEEKSEVFSNAQHGEWPWQVSFQYCFKRNNDLCQWEHLCGASIVDKKWVITAAHCIEESGFRSDLKNPGETWSVVVGMDKLDNSQLGKTNAGKRIILEKIKIHDSYWYRGVGYIVYSDIALLKLDEALEYNEFIQPIDFPDDHEPQNGDRCHVTGWGFTSANGTELSYNLKETEVTIFDFDTCRNNPGWYRLLNDNDHICAGFPVCGGFSGGPLSCKKPDGSFYLAGVSSFGFSDCLQPRHAGIFTRMTQFEEWAKSTIKNDSEMLINSHSVSYLVFILPIIGIYLLL